MTHRGPVDLVVEGAEVIATMGAAGELLGGWVAIDQGFVTAVGGPEAPPEARRVLRADGCVVTPGLVNSHHHIYQNLTRSFAPATRLSLLDWLREFFPHWALLDEESAYLAMFVGLAELALGGCTTTTDHLYVHPKGRGDLLAASVAAACEMGLRFHPTRGSMSVSQKNGGLAPPSICEDEDTILAESERAVRAYHDPAPGAMLRIGLAPCSLVTVSKQLMCETAELAARLDVRLHTHLAEHPDEDARVVELYGCRPVELFEEVGWLSDRAWVAHCVHANPSEVARLAGAGVGVAHCPSSNLMHSTGLAPVAELVAAGAPVGLGCDGSSSADSASLWLESRTAMLLARLRSGATYAGRAGRSRGRPWAGRPAWAARANSACWPRAPPGTWCAGAWTGPVRRSAQRPGGGPFALRACPGLPHSGGGRPVVEEGRLVNPDIEDRLRRHKAAAAHIQGKSPAN